MSASPNLYENFRSECPQIPDVVLNDPANRGIKVIIIGAGVGGILHSYNIDKQCSNVQYTVYEKNSDVGGTWFENRYPGCACDVPSHNYSYHFAPNPHWPKFLSSREDIWAYLDRVCNVFNLRRNMKFESEVIEARWDDALAIWRVKIRQTIDGGSPQEIEDTCNVLWYSTGLLNKWKWPEVEGLGDFKGKLMHSASWPEEYGQESWKGQKVVVIGSGASSLQIVPSMQPHVSHMDVFVRTGIWFAPLVEEYEADYVYSEAERAAFIKDPLEIQEHIKMMEQKLNEAYPALWMKSDMQKGLRSHLEKVLDQQFQDKRLLKGYLPNFSVGCRRITPGFPYIRAVQQENVNVHFTHVTKIVPTGVIGADGVLREADTIVCATGFDTTYRPRFPIIGKYGRNLQEKWNEEATAYFGVADPDMPNFIIHGGPPGPLQNGSPMGVFHALSSYGIQMIQKLQNENIRSLRPTASALRAFDDYIQALVPHTVFSDDCRSWYRNNKTGKVTNIYPGSALHLMEMLERPRWEDYEIEYWNENRFSFMGWGYVKGLKEPGNDLTYYLTPDKIDPAWVRAVMEIETNE
ncbi:flavin-binding monooxygenase-like protein [Melanomma pulvis-pyrius CBS 109.77]|uniref:Flavin-binding monooxygenase-like protein n=1 Tax=Melanomma pulvis-pyrius CBS 109.77 TaxID=1314802 RepID=A0A6A6XUS7_9PLEO|nr:flavin-binding monooxygenase-like protein [Melanomma pulvis-pyrius CBS 109.77]